MLKRHKKTFIKILVSSVLFAVILYQVDIPLIIQNISLMDLKYIPLILGLIIANYIISAIRWKILLIDGETKKVKVPYLVNLYFIGSFFNNFMPTSMGGDVYKIYKLGQKITNTTAAFTATFMERFTGFVALVLISYFGFIKTLDIWLGYLPQQVIQNSILLYGFYFLVFFGFWIAVFLAFIVLQKFSSKNEKIEKVYKSLILYKGKWKVLGWAFGTSFLVQLLAIFTQYFVLISLGIDIPVIYALLVFPVVTLAAFFIPSLNGIGVQDALYIQLLAPLGVSAELALSASIIYHLSRLVVSLYGGVLYAMGKAD